MARPFRQVDVFTEVPYLGNPVAVVLDGEGLDGEQMQRLARWTNLSETTFVLPPSDSGADYRVRIFTPMAELPFAGHPTLGTCHAWLDGGGVARQEELIVQECPAGLIPLRRVNDRLAFAAPPLVRSGPVDDLLVDEVAEAVGLDREAIVVAEWVDNGPGWLALLLDRAQDVLAARPQYIEQFVGLVGLLPEGSTEAIEVRAFFPKDGMLVEDPVTGSLNASLAQWLTSTGRLRTPYVASQGSALGRAGRVHVSTDDAGALWIGGGTITCVEGTIDA